MWIVSLSAIFGTALALVLAFLLTRKSDGRGKAGLVPGPRGFPILGHLPFMRKGILGGKCVEWAKKYGPIFRIKVGVVDIIMLNDYPSIEKFLCEKEVLYRPENMVFCDNEITGLATLNGQAWLDNRRICIRVLRDMGFGKKPMEEHIKEESRHLVKRLEGTDGSAVLVQGHVAASTSNNVSALVFGSLYDFEDPRRKAMVENLEEFMKALGTGAMIEFFPEWIRAVVMALPFARVVAIKKVIRNLIELTR
ncbi:cytochrome P450 2K4-like [Ixodes scapularis]|uniref:cytochrome P450 2K4-like n=1 Tax=Ixodes scapularis TaxID=6945 RepID=UPI001C38BE56|nr:cytochrome P450 2K4-like [Ixodes scapularis]